jgi:hypothetical protein
MPPRKIKVVDVIDNVDEPIEAIEAIEAIEDVPNPTSVEHQTPVDTPSQPPSPIEKMPTQMLQEPAQEKTTKTVELVECPDCKKMMSSKTLKYSHARTCSGKTKPKPEDQPTPEEQEPIPEEQEPIPEEQEPIPEELEPIPEKEEEEEVKQPPKLKRTVSVKKTINKAKPPLPVKGQEPQQPQITPTIRNIYGREQRNERLQQKSQKMNSLFNNAIQIIF